MSKPIPEVLDQLAEMNYNTIFNVCVRIVGQILKESEPNEEKRTLFAYNLVESALKEEGVSTSKIRQIKYVDDEKRCVQILKTGKNKGIRCSLSKKIF